MSHDTQIEDILAAGGLLEQHFGTYEERPDQIEMSRLVMRAFDEDEAMLKKWKAFCRKIDTKTDDYSTVLRTIKDFLTKPIISAVHATCFNEQWIAATNTWGQGGKCDG